MIQIGETISSPGWWFAIGSFEIAYYQGIGIEMRWHAHN